MIAYCGLECEGCNAFIATKNNDNALREKTAKEWSELYKADIKPQDINCAGCRSDGKKFHYAENLCEIRKCCAAKKLENCASCETFPCEKLNEFFKSAPQAKETLTVIRAK
ncbi:MAG: DUF3795 domain-containing protein [Elusimicrobia bacterium]|nr:DUF3795 domain-containing protein [Elusimicrobiota bacterium]